MVYRFFMPVIENGEPIYVVCIGITENTMFGVNIKKGADEIVVLNGKNRIFSRL